MIGTKEAAERLGVTQQAVRDMIDAGRLPAQKVGRDYVIDERDLKKRSVTERRPGRPPKKPG